MVEASNIPSCLAEFDTNSGWMAAIFVMMSLIWISMVFRRNKAKETQNKLFELEELRRKEISKDVLENHLLNIQELCREQIGILDTKIRILNRLLLEADKKIKTLQELPSHLNDSKTDK